MRKLKAAAVAVAVALGLWAAGAALAQENPEETAVRRTVQYYFDGLKNRDPETLKKAFHAEAKLYSVGRDGTLIELTQARWHEMITPSAQSPAKTYEMTGLVVSLEITGNAAAVKTIVEFPRVQFTDYLSLLKINGEWKIVNKIYAQKSQPAS